MIIIKQNLAQTAGAQVSCPLLFIPTWPRGGEGLSQINPQEKMAETRME